MQELNYLKDKVITPGAAPLSAMLHILWKMAMQIFGSMIFFRAYS